MESTRKPMPYTGVAPQADATPVPRSDSPFGRLVDGLNGLGSLLIFAMMVLVCSDVIARSFFNEPIYGVAELVALAIVAIVFLQLASTLRHKRMTRADLFIDNLMLRRPRAGRLLSALFNAAGLFACLVIVTATLPLLERAWNQSLYIGVEGLFTAPTWPVRMIVVIGAFITTVQYVIHLVEDVSAAIRGTANEE